MKKFSLLFLGLFISFNLTAQDSSVKAKSLLDEVSSKMGAYDNMFIGFSSSLVNEDAGIKENDEPPIRGNITLKGEKYNLDYLGNKFLFDGSKLYIINNDEKEINISDEDLREEDGFIYPS